MNLTLDQLVPGNLYRAIPQSEKRTFTMVMWYMTETKPYVTYTGWNQEDICMFLGVRNRGPLGTPWVYKTYVFILSSGDIAYVVKKWQNSLPLFENVIEASGE